MEATAALHELDSSLWTKQQPRSLDLLSEYANGAEAFILDGDALIQYVLNDELLDLDNLQSLHSTWLLESLLQRFIDRDCDFTIAFFLGKANPSPCSLPRRRLTRMMLMYLACRYGALYAANG